MEANQTLTHIIINITTYNSFPQVFLKLLDSSTILYKTSDNIMQYRLQDSVQWPGNITITESGYIILQYLKTEEKIWETPVIKSSDIVVYSEPHYHETVVLSNERQYINSCMLRLQFKHKVYIFMGVGRSIHVKSDTFDPKAGKVGRKRYMHVPAVPKKHLNETTPGIGTSRSMVESVNFIIKSPDYDRVGKWLCQRETGDIVSISAPSGTFHPDYFSRFKEVYFCASGIGIVSVMSMILYLLQQNKLQVSLFYACPARGNIMMQDMLLKLPQLSDKFTLKIFTESQKHFIWESANGMINGKNLLEAGVPLANTTSTKRRNYNKCFLISGAVPFCIRLSKLLKNRRKFNVPKNNIIKFF